MTHPTPTPDRTPYDAEVTELEHQLFSLPPEDSVLLAGLRHQSIGYLRALADIAPVIAAARLAAAEYDQHKTYICACIVHDRTEALVKSLAAYDAARKGEA
ncbi:MAG: hypothetical protein Q7K03_04235 [Dehalococcoidia bacterium]|nr:hypothetical protein [Dehalococcoidia bacterium]